MAKKNGDGTKTSKKTKKQNTYDKNGKANTRHVRQMVAKMGNVAQPVN